MRRRDEKVGRTISKHTLKIRVCSDQWRLKTYIVLKEAAMLLQSLERLWTQNNSMMQWKRENIYAFLPSLLCAVLLFCHFCNFKAGVHFISPQ